ncbi:MAG: cyclic nucleotide-binding domain-containing protein [Thermoanaerobaculia bacterium]|nr:cyclic nucleotide-binding domain-containing protein [Thermoanaerobaculia bacterium]
MAGTIELFRSADETETHTAGQTIFEEGSRGEVMYAVQKGEVDLLVHGKIVETVPSGGIFGEMALLDARERSATAVAKTDCRLAPVSQMRFNFLVQQTPMFALQVMRIMADRLRRMDESA